MPLRLALPAGAGARQSDIRLIECISEPTQPAVREDNAEGVQKAHALVLQPPSSLAVGEKIEASIRNEDGLRIQIVCHAEIGRGCLA